MKFNEDELFGAALIGFDMIDGPFLKWKKEYGRSTNLMKLDEGYLVIPQNVIDSIRNQGRILTSELEKIVKKGTAIKSCVRCSKARGYVDGEFDESQDRYPSTKSLEAVKIYSLYGFINMIKNTDIARSGPIKDHLTGLSGCLHKIAQNSTQLNITY